MCRKLKKVKNEKLVDNLHIICSKLFFKAAKLRLYKEIKLLVSKYLNEIIISVENIEKYKRNLIIRFLLFWINYHR